MRNQPRVHPLLFAFLLFVLSLPVQLAAGPMTDLVYKHFTANQRRAANTAYKASFLTAREKQVILCINLARMYPAEFDAFYLEYLQTMEPDGYQKLQAKDGYYYTLHRDLVAMKNAPVRGLRASQKMFNLAKCWAQESGRKGITGHNRTQCGDGYSAECCAYSYSDNPMELVLLLLVDEGVKSLGHRKIMLDGYERVGASIQPHRSYGHVLVLDFGFDPYLAKK